MNSRLGHLGRGSSIPVPRYPAHRQQADEKVTVATEHGLLCLTCVKCGMIFMSAMQMDPWTWEMIRLGQMRERCTSCGHIGLYRKADYYFASRSVVD